MSFVAAQRINMVPLTYCFPWVKGSREERKQWMREFAEAGADHIVLTSELLGKGCGDTGFLLDLARDMREFGLDFVDSHALWGTWSDPGMPLGEWREAMLLRHQLAFRFCLRFGVETMAFHTGNTFNSIFGAKLTLDDYYRALTDSLEVLLPEAEKCGVVIALENQWTPLNHSSVLLKVMEYFDSKHLGLCYDTGHGHLTEQGMNFPETTVVPAIWNDLGVPVKWEERLAEKFSPWLVNCHLHDNHGSRDDHLPPGQGTVDWARIKNVLRNSPRLRSIQNESSPHGGSITEFCRSFRDLFRDFE
jgi:sugar phosphate isomerase/epimerase